MVSFLYPADWKTELTHGDGVVRISNGVNSPVLRWLASRGMSPVPPPLEARITISSWVDPRVPARFEVLGGGDGGLYYNLHQHQFVKVEDEVFLASFEMIALYPGHEFSSAEAAALRRHFEPEAEMFFRTLQLSRLTGEPSGAQVAWPVGPSRAMHAEGGRGSGHPGAASR
jgi:hypothetical protein